MGKAKVDHITITVVDREATTNEEKFKQAELYGKSAAAFLNSVKNSPYLSSRVADVELMAKANPETGETVKGHLANIKFFDAADGTRIEDPKERRFKVDLDRITFKTSNKEQKEYTVNKPVNRDRETGNVTNLEDRQGTPGLKTILAALNEENELYISVDKKEIDGRDVWMIADAKPLSQAAPEAGIKGMAANAPEGASLEEAAAAVKQKGKQKEMKA